jgi:hypothetical protein
MLNDIYVSCRCRHSFAKIRKLHLLALKARNISFSRISLRSFVPSVIASLCFTTHDSLSLSDVFCSSLSYAPVFSCLEPAHRMEKMYYVYGRQKGENHQAKGLNWIMCRFNWRIGHCCVTLDSLLIRDLRKCILINLSKLFACYRIG